VEQERKRLEQLRDDIAAVEGVLHTHPRSPGARESSPSRSTVKDAEQATQRTMGAARTAVEELQKTASTLEAATAEIAAAPPTVRRDDLASGIADLVALCKAKDAEVAATKRTSEEQQRTIEQLRSELGEGASQTDTLGQALAALQAAAQSACNTLEPTATPTRGKPVEPKQLTAAAQRAREALTSTEAQLEEARSEVEQERKRLEQLRDDIAAVEGVLHTHAATLAWGP
jgi:chromosome segregation ATPase